jgi:hypothetical protein
LQDRFIKAPTIRLLTAHVLTWALVHERVRSSGSPSIVLFVLLLIIVILFLVHGVFESIVHIIGISKDLLFELIFLVLLLILLL